MLDDEKVLSQRDPSGYLAQMATQPSQLLHDFGLQEHRFETSFTSVVFAGMGGSALAADYATVYPAISVPFVVSKGYDLPDFVNERTLVICASYSGNTEETLSAFEQAQQKNATIVALAAGGKLLERASHAGCLTAAIPYAPQPRAAVLYSYRALCEVLIAAGLIDATVIDDFAQVAQELQGACEQWVASVPEDDNRAKQLAQYMLGKTLIIYGGKVTAPAAYKWKIDANENAKNTAWAGVLPEYSHNEFLGWSSHPIEKPFAIINLLSHFERPRIRERFEVGDRLLSGQRPAPISVLAEGSSLLSELLYLVLLGDFATVYLAVLNKVDPAPVDLVERFKTSLSEQK